MLVQEAVTGRRTIFKFVPRPVAAEALDQVLTAGLWAQNHRMTEPWRFTVLGPETHHALALAFGEAQLQALRSDEEPHVVETMRSRAMEKILSKPAVVVVTYRLSPDEHQRWEDFAATCCSIQNIQLAAWAEGLGMQWSSNRMIRNPVTYELLDIDPAAEEVIAFLYFGYPAEVPEPRPRKPLAEVMRRLP